MKLFTWIGSLFLFCFLAHLEADTTYSYVDHLGEPLDHKLLKIINFRNGVFIEVGAHDGLFQSNTKLLEEAYDWTGILVEPSPSLFTTLCQNRPKSKCFQCALGTFEQDGTYGVGDFDGDCMASINGARKHAPATQKVLMRSLQSILDETHVRHVHFLSLDTEGYELNILKGIDYDRTTFDYLLIEIYKDQYDEIVSYLSQKGYQLVECFSGYNRADNPGWDGTHNDYLFTTRRRIVNP